MTEQQLDHFKNLFTAIIKANTQEEMIELVQEVAGDDVDQMQLEKERALRLKLNQRNATYLKKVESALGRIEEKTFGECMECGADIGWNRLIARPTAHLCINCKEEEERGEHQTFQSSEKKSGLNVIEFENTDTQNIDVNKSFQKAIQNFDKAKANSKYGYLV